MIKCSKGIAFVNPEDSFISSNDVVVEVSNSLNQDHLRCGNYWELGFDFPIIIEPSLSNDSGTHYVFKKWKKLGDINDGSPGIEIGRKTALFFIYSD